MPLCKGAHCVAEAPPRLQRFLYPNLSRHRTLGDGTDQMHAVRERAQTDSGFRELLARLAHHLDDDLGGDFSLLQGIDLDFIAKQEDQRIDAQLLSTLDFIKDGGTRLPDDPEGIMTASLLLGVRAHDGEVRKNGRPYMHHPMAVAAITAVLLEGHSGRRRDTALGFAHDTFEHELEEHVKVAGLDILFDPSVGEDDELIVTPRMLHRLFELLGRADGATASKELLLLTKHHGYDGEKIERVNYAQGIHSRLGTSAIKFADQDHNGMDSVPPDLATSAKRIRTLQEYKDANAATKIAHPSLNYAAATNAARVLDAAWPVYGRLLSQPDVAQYLADHDTTIEIGEPPYDEIYAENAA